MNAFLKKVGADLKVALGLAIKEAPLGEAIAAAAGVPPAAIGEIASFASIFTGIEAVAGSTVPGPQKLLAALPLADSFVKTNPLFSGKVVADVEKYETALKGFASNFVDLLNSFAPSSPAAPGK